MLLSLCSDKRDAFGLAIGVEKVQERELSCHPGHGWLLSRLRRHV
jgi:hypothetical protein